MRLTVGDISLSLGGRQILTGLSTTLSSADFAVCAGANGAGKTMLLQLLAGLIEPSEGTLSPEPAGSPPPGLVFQEPDAQILGRTVESDLRIGMPETDQRDQGRLEFLLSFAGLSSRRTELCHRLSGGEKRRLTIASALATGPELLLLDEPFTYLDAAGVADVLRQIVGIHQAGCGILVVSHDLEKILAHANRLLLLREGCLVYDGPPSEGLELLTVCGLRRPAGEIEDWSWIN